MSEKLMGESIVTFAKAARVLLQEHHERIRELEKRVESLETQLVAARQSIEWLEERPGSDVE